ncbi:hypothetical protein RB195_008314 [Necator americanus]|uniref:N-acetyltransferase domain-containing protein n=1 Tax=Necator americanus TaxID=51031 RepID=A0ABR1CPZ5_NECAM
MDRYSLTPLYYRQDLNRKCIELLNEEWPRSDGSREHSQAKSCRSSPPMSFLFIDNENDTLIGHARICLLPNRPTSCWIESVIIAKDLRGQGLGKSLMTRLENAAKEFGFDEAFLSTDDQVIFYERCGYSKCEPILHSTTSTSVFPVMSKLMVHDQNKIPGEALEKKMSNGDDVSSPNGRETTTFAPPPAPPPPPVQNCSPSKTLSAPVSTVGHQYMCKKLV